MENREPPAHLAIIVGRHLVLIALALFVKVAILGQSFMQDFSVFLAWAIVPYALYALFFTRSAKKFVNDLGGARKATYWWIILCWIQLVLYIIGYVKGHGEGVRAFNDVLEKMFSKSI